MATWNHGRLELRWFGATASRCCSRRLIFRPPSTKSDAPTNASFLGSRTRQGRPDSRYGRELPCSADPRPTCPLARNRASGEPARAWGDVRGEVEAFPEAARCSASNFVRVANPSCSLVDPHADGSRSSGHHESTACVRSNCPPPRPPCSPRPATWPRAPWILFASLPPHGFAWHHALNSTEIPDIPNYKRYRTSKACSEHRKRWKSYNRRNRGRVVARVPWASEGKNEAVTPSLPIGQAAGKLGAREESHRRGTDHSRDVSGRHFLGQLPGVFA